MAAVTRFFFRKGGFLPLVGAFRVAAQLLRSGLSAAAFERKAQGLRPKRLVVITPFVGRRPAEFGCYNIRNIQPSSACYSCASSFTATYIR